MERKISSDLTEFYKIKGILSIALLFILLSFGFFNFFSFSFSLFIFISLLMFLFLAFDYWRMKEVEMTDSGLIITDRFFFKQKSIFVPYQKIEVIDNRLWWLGNKKRTTINFLEKTEFGEQVVFISKGFKQMKQVEIIEEINRAVIRRKNPNGLKPFHNQLEG